MAERERDPFWRNGKCVLCDSVMEEEGQHCDDCPGEKLLSDLRVRKAVLTRPLRRQLRKIAKAAEALLESYVRNGFAEHVPQALFADLSEALLGPEHGWTQELRR